MRSVTLAAVLLILGLMVAGGNALAEAVDPTLLSAPSSPSFNLGFKALADQIPDVVGQPVEDEHWEANGDSQQRSTVGLMVWRKSDNWTAFTNGSATWINGPLGVQSRNNDERFGWEIPILSGPVDSGEITLYDRRGYPTAYIAVNDENTIYLWTGEPVAYLYQNHVYGFNGHHLGWFQDGIVWDFEGISVGYTPKTLIVSAKAEPPKSTRLPEPSKVDREAPPVQPTFTSSVYTELLSTFLRMGQQQ